MLVSEAFGRWSVYNAMAIMVTLCNLVFPGLIILRAAVAHAISYFRGPDALYIDFLAPGAVRTPVLLIVKHKTRHSQSPPLLD
jgi:hypothetical protein